MHNLIFESSGQTKQFGPSFPCHSLANQRMAGQNNSLQRLSLLFFLNFPFWLEWWNVVMELRYTIYKGACRVTSFIRRSKAWRQDSDWFGATAPPLSNLFYYFRKATYILSYKSNQMLKGLLMSCYFLVMVVWLDSLRFYLWVVICCSCGPSFSTLSCSFLCLDRLLSLWEKDKTRLSK